MSVCATCLQSGLPADGRHDCPGLGDIQLTRQLGHGLRVDTAPARARMALTVLADHGHGLTMQGADMVNIADQVLYQVVGYDPESAALVLELVEDWRPDSVKASGAVPGFIPFARPEHIARGETSGDPLVVEPYRNDQNQDRWVFRCWGTASCDGWLSLDHTSEQWAQRARDRHVAEEHGTSAPAATESATCTAILTDSVLTDGAPHHCVAPAGHYDETRQPEYPEGGESDPRGWHHTEPGGDGVRTVWADWADGATPHGPSKEHP